MFHFKAPGQCLHRDFVAFEWGEFVRYVEVSDDQHAVRQIDVYENGNVLRYDRTHWCDDFGQLLGLRFSRKPKWAAHFPGAQLINAGEFEKLWHAAEQSPLWEQQLSRSRVNKWRNVSSWLLDRPIN